METEPIFDTVVVGGGPAGATAANDLARLGHAVLMLDRSGRIKPCGGAIPPRLIRDFEIPDHLLVARITAARMIAPSTRTVDIPIEGGFVGMVDREHFDEWLRHRATESGAKRISGTFETLTRDANGVCQVNFRRCSDGALECVRARCVIGADGARSKVAEQAIPGADYVRYVFAYHEVVRATPTLSSYLPTRCDVVYQGALSPDFYSWVFPHGENVSIGSGTAITGFSLRKAVTKLRHTAGLGEAETVRREGAPIPLRAMRRWDNQRDVLVAGDAAGVVAPASGEGIYYAMVAGREAANAAHEFLLSGEPAKLGLARKRFMKAHGRVFLVLGVMQWFWYRNDRLRERFVSICRDKDVQKLTFDAYMNKELVRAKPLAHVRIFFKDLAHLTGLARP